MDAGRGRWSFLVLEKIASRAPDNDDSQREDLRKQLEAASHRFFRAWKLIPWLWVPTALAAFGAVTLLILFSDWLINHIFSIASVVAGILLLVFFGKKVPILEGVMTWGIRLSLVVLGFPVSLLNIYFADRLLKKRGSIERLMKMS